MSNMAGKVAIVTGAAEGIGRATAMLLSQRGARVVLSDVNTEGGDQTLRDIIGAGGSGLFVRCDISNPESIRAMIEAALSAYGRLDVACNNAGIEGTQASTVDCGQTDWEHVINVNLRGTWLCMKHEIPAILAGGGGAIVNVSSIAGLVGFAGMLA